MALITTGAIPKSLKPIIKEWINISYEMYEQLWKDYFTVLDSEEAYEEIAGFFGTSLATRKSEGKGINYDSVGQGHITRSVHDTFGIGIILTKEHLEDNRYEQLVGAKSKAMGTSMAQTKDTYHTNILNRGFNASYTGGDGKTLFNSAHPLSKGIGTFSNTSTAIALSEASLEQACIDIAKWTDEAGMQAKVKTECIIIPPDLEFTANRILNSQLQNNTANNALNVLASTSKFPKGIKANVFLDSTTAWFVKTDVKGLYSFDRRSLEFSEDNDFDTDNLKMKVTERYSATWGDPRCAYGNAGA
jgi:phage major head subunit gpT-like protein